jgi:hypothetical protein
VLASETVCQQGLTVNATRSISRDADQTNYSVYALFDALYLVKPLQQRIHGVFQIVFRATGTALKYPSFPSAPLRAIARGRSLWPPVEMVVSKRACISFPFGSIIAR